MQVLIARSICDNKSQNCHIIRMGQIKRTTGKEGNHSATIYQPINSQLYPLGREAARTDTIYALSCSLEKGQPIPKRSLEVCSHLVQNIS